MKRDKLFNAIGEIDDRFIDEIADDIAKDKSNGIAARASLAPWLKWSMPIAACLLVAVGVFGWQSGLFDPHPDNTGTNVAPISPELAVSGNQGNQPDTENIPPDTAHSSTAYFVFLGDSYYGSITFEDRKKYGLVEQTAEGLTPDNTYVITEKDLGAVMGKVDGCGDETLLGATVYHYAAFPNSDGICIVRRDTFSEALGTEEYEFYTFAGKVGAESPSLSGKEILQLYGLTWNTVSRIEVFTGTNISLKLGSITDATQITQLLEIIAKDNVSISMDAHNELWRPWLESLDNPDERLEIDERYQRWVVITSTKGLDINLIYNAHIKTISVLNSNFVLTDESVAVLDRLLLVDR
jgi:hypothetical protein